MNKELEVLHKIFDFETPPPPYMMTNSFENFYLVHHVDSGRIVGQYRKIDKYFYLAAPISDSILRKIKIIFNLDKLSDDDVYHIAKHLLNWLNTKLSEEIAVTRIWNNDSGNVVSFQITNKE